MYTKQAASTHKVQDHACITQLKAGSYHTMHAHSSQSSRQVQVSSDCDSLTASQTLPAGRCGDLSSRPNQSYPSPCISLKLLRTLPHSAQPTMQPPQVLLRQLLQDQTLPLFLKAAEVRRRVLVLHRMHACLTAQAGCSTSATWPSSSTHRDAPKTCYLRID
jgi:hypothetical protein